MAIQPKPHVITTPGNSFTAYLYDDGLVWLYRGIEQRENVRVPNELGNVLKARLAMDDHPHDAMRDVWWASIAYWRRCGVTNRAQVGNAI